MPDLTWGQLPRVPMLDARNIPVPESGYVGAGEVMERLLYAWWGTSADEPSGYINDEPVGPGTPVGNVVASGHLYECTKILVEAAGRGEIEGAVFVDGNIRVFPTAYWDNRTWQEWAGDFLDGILTHAPDGYPDWADGQLLMFAREAVAEWICSLVSPHRLPAPLKRNPGALTNDPVTLSQAVTWLSDGTPQEWWEPPSPFSEGASRAIADLKDPDTDSFEPSRRLAGCLAYKEREADAKDAVLSAIKSDKLTAFGEQTSGDGMMKGRLREIPRHYFRYAVTLTPGTEDTIGPDRDTDGDNLRRAVAAGTWKDVQFDRADLVQLWGGTTNGDSAKARSKGGAPPKMDKVVAWFHQKFPGEDRRGLTWEEVTKMAEDALGIRIRGYDSIRNAVRSRRKRYKR